MQSAAVATNLTCNQNCAYCGARQPAEARAFVHPTAVLARISAAVASGAREVLLTGGEPTLRRDLSDLVAAVAAQGAVPVLETNAALVDAAMASSLATAGLARARIHLPGWGDVCDAVTRDPGGFAATLSGMRALARAGVILDIHAPVIRQTLGHLRELPARLKAAELAIDRILIELPLSSPDPMALASLPEAAIEIDALELGARQAGITLQLDNGSFLPPCLFRQPDRVAHLYALGRGSRDREGYRQVEECDGCVARDRCPGLPNLALARGAIALRPLTDDRTRRRLTVIGSTREQVARELVTHESWRGENGEVVEARAVRINFQCNQSCHFCFVSTHLPTASDDAIRDAIVEAGEARATLIVSGGEPTLNPKLLDWIRLGKASGVPQIELQTNAIRLATGTLAADLASAGVDVALVSLHGSNAEISDAITDAPGTFERTVLGLDRLAETSIQVRLNFVVCATNQNDFPRYIEMVATRWKSFSVTLSFVGSHTDVVPRTKDLIPRYTDVMPALLEGLADARRRGLVVSGFESMCGIPLCLVPEAGLRFSGIAEVSEGAGGGEFVKAEACSRCDLANRCFGVRRGYADLHGTAELVAVRSPLMARLGDGS